MCTDESDFAYGQIVCVTCIKVSRSQHIDQGEIHLAQIVVQGRLKLCVPILTAFPVFERIPVYPIYS